MKTSLSTVLLVLLSPGCGTTERTAQSLHDAEHTARPPYDDIAVNLGQKRESDLFRLYDSLASHGVRCGMTASSLGAEQIVVERDDFDRAKGIITEIIVRDKLTVRVYESVDFDKSPANSLLEVWQDGQKVREENYKIYPD